MAKIIDLISQQFGRLTVVKRDVNYANGEPQWFCLCECGNTSIVRGYSLRKGFTKSCGCFMRSKGVRKNCKQIQFNCDFCGTESSDKPSSFVRKKKHFCSAKCYADFAKQMPFYETNAYKGVRQKGESKQVYHRNYCKNNPENIAHLKARRYARERGADGSHTKAEWDKMKQQFGDCCAICGQNKPLTKDHIIPLSKGGSDFIFNIQPLCKNCNSKKHNKLNFHLPSVNK